MISSVSFRNFKALRDARLALTAFNLIIGPNGSGKSSLIESLLRLRLLSRLPLRPPGAEDSRLPDGPEVTFSFFPPHEHLEAVMSCISDRHCDLLQVRTLPGGSSDDWPALRAQLSGIRGYVLDARAMAEPAPAKDGGELAASGANLAAVLAARRQEHPAEFAALEAEFIRIAPEYAEIASVPGDDSRVRLRLRLREGDAWVDAEDISQGELYLLAFLAIVFSPAPPPVVCVEEIDRGIHPRLLREVRDILYRLSDPAAFGLARPPSQVIATTHSPYFLDLFRTHPEEVVISQRRGATAGFSRLTDRPDIAELLQEGPLGDMWYAGILGGVPDTE